MYPADLPTRDRVAGNPEPAIADNHRHSRGFVERFLDSFFQEKNIKWMLVIGAAIVFGSSLMLVTKAWPQWTPSLKYLAIVGYTAVIFLAAEVSRKRLNLSATYRVLQSLTLLLLPVCFFSLTWLTPGTAMQDLSLVAWQLVLALPAIALLWYASTRILDHWLRGRQTTFLLSYGLLCVAGASPKMASPLLAFGFTMLSWMIFTAGVIKINRHTFWLTETYRLPRVFGFLPIAMLGLQFVVLVGTKAVSVLPVQWIGFAIVLVAATILVTARSVAEVVRQRTGDLVRPLPWSIIAPLFAGLSLTVIGIGLSMAGFSYTGTTTYAVIPTALLGAAIFALVARDTREGYLVWASLIALSVAYQCSPVLLSELVQTVRSATADAINRDRVPLSMYGLTYLPLLSALALLSGIFHRRSLTVFAKPIQQFVTIVSVGLLSMALTDLTSLFLVCVAYVAVFMAFAFAFRDRRYAMASVITGVLAVAVAIPAGNQMDWWQVSVHWIPTLLAGVALLMTLSNLPDRWLRRIPMPNDSAQSDRNWTQLIGCGIATSTGLHWMVAASVSFWQPLMPWSWIQFGFLILAVVLYTLRNPSYLSAACVWILLGFAATRSAFGVGYSPEHLAIIATYVFVFGSLIGFALSRWVGGNKSTSRWVGGNKSTSLNDVQQGWIKRVMAFAVPLRDLSAYGMLVLTTVLYVPGWVIQHVTGILDNQIAIPGFGIASLAVATAMIVVGWRAKHPFFAHVSVFITPIAITSLLFSTGVSMDLTHLCLIWVIVQSIATIILVALRRRHENAIQISAMIQAINFSLILPVAVSCLSFDWSMRLVFVVAAVTWWRNSKTGLFLGDLRDLAIATNIQFFLVAAALCGGTGWLHMDLLSSNDATLIASMLATGTLSILFFDHIARIVDGKSMSQWADCLRWTSSGLAMLCLSSEVVHRLTWNNLDLAIATLGLSLLAASEIAQAVVRQRESRVWTACLVILSVVAFLYLHNVISIGVGLSQFVLLGIGVAALGITSLSKDRPSLSIFLRPMTIIGSSMPAAVATLAVVREFSDRFASSSALGSLALMIAAGIYFYQAFVTGRRIFSVHGTIIANLGLLFLWRTLGWNAAELYLIPIGLSMLALTELLSDKLPKQSHNPLRYIAVCIVLCSPLFEVLGGSWLHMFSLMLISVVVILAAIGLRLRSLVYAGSAFLMFDLIAMVIRSTIHNLNLLWILGVVLGVCVIALAAFCENHRDKLLSRIRILSAELATWN